MVQLELFTEDSMLIVPGTYTRTLYWRECHLSKHI